jgi:hypothetical protein
MWCTQAKFLFYFSCYVSADQSSMQGLRLLNVSCSIMLIIIQFYNESVPRFLYADPTRGALQVLSRSSGVINSSPDERLPESGEEDGLWINADPIPGCVVVNIGESESLKVLREQA